MVRRYLVDTPDRLWNLMLEVPETVGGSVRSLAKVWRAMARQGKSGPMDGHIFAVFDNGSTPRQAHLVRIDRDGREIQVGTLFRYNVALKWCREHLEAA